MTEPCPNGPPLLLASASPRRRRLLAWLGVPYQVTQVETPEDLDSPLAGVPPVLARSISAEKALAAREAAGPTAAVLACDTIVVDGRRVLGKPVDLDEARSMLRGLSGREHVVITGVAVDMPGWKTPRTFAVTTPVRMNELDAAAIEGWVEKGELLGCAGAYNIESHLASVEADQCYQNVAGLPLCHVYAGLVRAGFAGLTSPVAQCDASRGTKCRLGPRVAGTAGV